MATLALPFKATTVLIAPLVHNLMELAPPAQGIEGQKIQEAAEAAFWHWDDRPAHFLLEAGDADELSYDPVPPTTVFSVPVKYRFVGRAKPMPYPLDE